MSPDEIVTYAGAIALAIALVLTGAGAGLAFAIAFGNRIFHFITRARP